MQDHFIVVGVDRNSLVRADMDGNVFEVCIKILAQNFGQKNVHGFWNGNAAGVDNAGTKKMQNF